jgi:hypothetical protein
MSTFSSVSTNESATPNYAPSVKNFFTKMYPVSGSNMAHTLLSTLYRAKPDIFVVSGGIHNNTDGSRTYLSVRIYVSNEFHLNMHLYGIVRGSAFSITDSEIYIKEEGVYKTYAANFVRPDDWKKGGAPHSSKKFW